MKKLTIGIPTYNRLEKLKRTVGFFEKEGVFQNDKIQFVISNNASTDGTKEYLAYLKNKYPEININNNTTNKGVMGNLEKITYMSNATYIWYVGDDDYLYDGIVNSVLKELDSSDISWLFLKHDFLSSSGKRKPTLQCDEYYENGLDLFNVIACSEYKLGGMMFITGSIHKTQNARKVFDIYLNDSEYKKYGNMAVPLGMSFYSAASGAAKVTSKELILDDWTGISWADQHYKVFCRDQIAILDLYAKKLSINLVKSTSFEKGLVISRPEWTFIKHKGSDDNYAMKFYLRHYPFRIIKDLIAIIFRKIRRKAL